MTTSQTAPTVAPGGRSPRPSRDALQLIADGVTEVVGFEVAAISVVRDDDALQMVAVAGSDEARRTLRGQPHPDRRADGGDRGRRRLGPAQVRAPRAPRPRGRDRGLGARPRADRRPRRLAPARPAGRAACTTPRACCAGCCSIDLPADGRRPGPTQRRMLQRYAEQAGRAVVTALERDELAEQVRLAEAARGVIRNASSHLALEDVLNECQVALAEGFRARGVWVQTFGEDDHGAPARSTPPNEAAPVLGPELEALAEISAQPRLGVPAGDRGEHRSRPSTRVDRPHRRAAPARSSTSSRASSQHDALRAAGRRARVPRQPGADPRGRRASWTETEASAALDIGHDLGRAVLNARTFEREHLLVQELQALDSYKSQLIATVSHELKNPLTAILGHLEMLESVDVAAGRCAPRCRRWSAARDASPASSDDLLLLARVDDPPTRCTAAPSTCARWSTTSSTSPRSPRRDATSPCGSRPRTARWSRWATPTSSTGCSPTC